MATPVVQVPHSGRMRYRLIAIISAVALASAGCGSSDDPEPPSTPAQKPPAVATSAAATADAAGQDAYLQGLAAIDPGLVANEDRALSRAKDTCLDIKQGEITGDKLNERVAERLSGGDAQITPAQAAKVISLAKTTVC